MSQDVVPTLIADRYRILRPLGSGGDAATVFEAEDELLRRRVAVKRLPIAGDEAQVRRALRSARIAASLDHPNLVTVFEALAPESELVLVTEYVEGESLARALHAGPVTRLRALYVLRGVAAGLDHAHDHGLAHSDVRPENVLLGRSGVVKLSNLGIDGGGRALRGKKEDDVYALAAMASPLLGGVEGASPPLAAVLERGLARDPSRRPARAGAFVALLTSALGGDEETKAIPMSVDKAAAEEPTLAARPARPAAAEEPTVAARPVRRAAAEEPTVAARPVRPAAAEPRGAPNRRLAVLVAVLALVLVAGGLASLLLRGSDDPSPAQRDSPSQAVDRPDGQADGATPDGSVAQDSEANAPAAVPPATDAAAVAAGSESVSDPVGAVRAFYGRASRQDAVGVCALRGVRLQLRFECGELTRQFQTLRSVAFDRITIESRSAQKARVRIATVATHTDHADRCRGTVDLVPSGAGDWLLDDIAVDCVRTAGAK